MKNALVETLESILGSDTSTYLLTADLGFMALEPLLEKYPDRCINVGIAEANMIGIAGGLARAGKTVYCYSMIPFITLRCLEQVRLQLAKAQLNIKLIGVGAGYTYGVQGSSHHATEDIGLIRALPGIAIVCPGTAVEMNKCLMESHKKPGPFYIRIGWPTHPFEEDDLAIDDISEPRLINGSGDAKHILLSYGPSLGSSFAAVNLLKQREKHVDLYSLASLRPINWDRLNKIIENKSIGFIEPNCKEGGFAEALALEVVSKNIPIQKLVHLNYRSDYFQVAGSNKFLEEKNNMHPEGISDFLLKEFFNEAD
jgi:transketolase